MDVPTWTTRQFGGADDAHKAVLVMTSKDHFPAVKAGQSFGGNTIRTRDRIGWFLYGTLSILYIMPVTERGTWHRQERQMNLLETKRVQAMGL